MSNEHREQAREIVSAHSKHSVVVRQEQLVEAIQVALSSRDAEIREVLEGLRSNPDGCWCALSHLTETTRFEEDGTHDNACLAARALWERVKL